MDSYIDTIVSEKHTVSIFRTSALKTNKVHFSETLVYNESTWCHGSEEQYLTSSLPRELKFHKLWLEYEERTGRNM
jgi:hypothetical protein